jgi:glycosyltransferase involved in cell wall biosynthesis
MKISIITVCFNSDQTIRNTIESVLSQAYSDIEYIIVDGSSTDRTVNIIKQFKPLFKGRMNWISEPDKGLYDAMNKGIAVATGEVVAFLHSDDLYFDENVISKVAEVFSNDSVDVVYGDTCFFSGSNVTKTLRRYRSDKLSSGNLAWGKMPAHPAIFIRRRIYDEVGYFETDFEIAADYEFLCRLVKYANLKSVYLSSVLVRMQLGGASTGGLRSTILLNKEVLKAIRKNGIYTNMFMLLSKYPSKIMQFLRR